MLNVGDRPVVNRTTFSLTAKVVSLDTIAILLQIFQSDRCVVSKRLDTVKSRDALHVFSKCREDLTKRGLVQVEANIPAHSTRRRAVAA